MKKLLSAVAIVATLFVFSSCVKQFSSGSTVKIIDGIRYGASFSYEKSGCGKGELSASVSMDGAVESVNNVTVTFDDEVLLNEETLAIPWEENYKWKVKDGKHSLDFNFKTPNGNIGHATIIFEVSGSSSSVIIIS